MRLYTIERVKPSAEMKRWPAILRVRMEESSIPNYGDLCSWCRNNFKGYFGIVEVAERMVAGFSTNGRDYYPSVTPRVSYYEVRCDKNDAQLFLKRWRIPKDEYERNVQYSRDLGNRTRGWWRIDGVSVGFDEVIAIARKDKRAFNAMMRRYKKRGT